MFRYLATMPTFRIYTSSPIEDLLDERWITVVGESQWKSIKVGDNHNILNRVELASTTLYLFCLLGTPYCWLQEFHNISLFLIFYLPISPSTLIHVCASMSALVLCIKTSPLVFKPLEGYTSCCKEFMSSMWTTTWQEMVYLLVTIIDLHLQIAKHSHQSRQISYMAH
jgi:hypothetical protein